MSRFIHDFSLLGLFLEQFREDAGNRKEELEALNTTHFEHFESLIASEHIHNPWFTPESVRQALGGIAAMLQEEVLEQWLSRYRLRWPEEDSGEKTVGLVMAANIPLVGFHDILSVLACGHRVLARASSRDDRLIKAVVEILGEIDPIWPGKITLTEEPLKNLDAVIATGSNNSARHFEYYFRHIPHIIRKNRNGVAVLTGDESEKEMEELGRDVFSFFGLGCRNVAKIFVPENYDLTRFMAAMDSHVELIQHNKFANNLAYYRSIYLLNQAIFLDNGVLLLKEDSGISSPVGVVFYERYAEIESLAQVMETRAEEIQCIVSVSDRIPGRILPGESQQPMPWDYADGIDTLDFISKLD